MLLRSRERLFPALYLSSSALGKSIRSTFFTIKREQHQAHHFSIIPPSSEQTVTQHRPSSSINRLQTSKTTNQNGSFLQARQGRIPSVFRFCRLPSHGTKCTCAMHRNNSSKDSHLFKLSQPELIRTRCLGLSAQHVLPMGRKSGLFRVDHAVTVELVARQR